MSSERVLALIVAACLVVACEHDVVLPDAPETSTCGNGVLEPGEACDVASPGCASCQVVPTWTCDATTCTRACGDGIGGASCDRRDDACDMTGYWAVRETSYSRDAILNGLQTSSEWSLVHLTQSGDGFVVAESLDCGIHVTGSVTVDMAPASVRAQIHRNRMDAASPHAARHGISRATASGCALALDRWYYAYGIVESLLPADFSAKPSLASLPPMPHVDDPVNDTTFPNGADDPDGDGIPGAAFEVSGIVGGVRNLAEREWREYATPAGSDAPTHALTLAFPGAWDVQDSVLRVTQCGNGCALLTSAAHAAADQTPRITMTFIGKTLGSAGVSAVVAGPLRANLDDDLTTCAKVRALLPHAP